LTENSHKPNWIRQSREEIFSSDYVNLYRDSVKLPNGETIPDYYIVNYGLGAVGIILEDDDGRILLVEHYRYSIDRTLWEVPAGRIDENEEPIQSAKRELLEETGFECLNLEQIGISHPMVGNSDIIFYFFKGSDFKKISQELDDEILGLKWFSKDEIFDLLKKNHILSGLCQSCLLHSIV